MDRDNPDAENMMMEWEREAAEAEALAAMRADDEAAANRALDARAAAEAEEREASGGYVWSELVAMDSMNIGYAPSGY